MIRHYSKYGLLIASSLIVFFLLMKLIGWHQYPILSIFNGLLFGAGIYHAIKRHLKEHPHAKYQQLWQAGFLSGAIATLIFTAFMAIYMYQINGQFATQVLDSWNVNYNTGVLTILFSMVLMGLATSIVCALTFMQLFKRTWNPSNQAHMIPADE